MKFFFSFLVATGLSVFAAVAAVAASHTVTVGPNNSLTFSPSTLTIDAGDTVTFTYAGGTMPHNVVANDGSFRCAKGCDGSGGNGNATGAAFSFTLTFNTPGTIGYYCEIHGAPGVGMHGTIVVNDVAPPQPTQNIVPGLSGNWFNPTANQAGHGFQFEILPGDGMLAIWFVFNPPGTAQAWIYAQGGYDPSDSDVTLPAFLEQGGAFPPNFDSGNLTLAPWGTLEFHFTDCDHGMVEWQPNNAAIAAGYAQATFPVQRVTSIAGLACP